MKEPQTNEAWFGIMRGWDVPTADLTDRISSEIDAYEASSTDLGALVSEVRALRKEISELRLAHTALCAAILDLRHSHSSEGRISLGSLLSPFTQPDARVRLS
jgi:hypothetical protein